MQSNAETTFKPVAKNPHKSTTKSKHTEYIVKGCNENIPCLISKPEQAKKTIEMAKLIERDIDLNPYVLSIYIAQSRKNQVNKAAEGFMNFILEKRGITGLSILHGEKDNSHDPDGYIYRALQNNNRLIAGLANKTRLEIIKNIILRWLTHSKCYIVKIYCDEAQKTFPLFIKHIYSQLKKDVLSKVYPILIDAHVEGIITAPIYKKYFKGRINKLENQFDLTQYLFMSSFKFEHMEWRNNDDILASYTNEKLIVDTKDYILWPLSYKKQEQYDAASNIVNTIPNSTVLIINGDAYHVIYMPDGLVAVHKQFKKVNCKKNDCYIDTCSTCFPELNNSELAIVKKIKGKYARNKTFVLSGHQCIDRAMTYSTPDMPFTKAIIASDIVINKSFFDKGEKKWEDCSITKREDMSQMVKRLCASYKKEYEIRNISLPIFYGPADIFNGICQLENVSKTVSGMSGILDQSVLDSIKENLKINNDVDLKKIHTIMLTELEQPHEYYYKAFKCNDNNPEDIQCILSDFRSKIGGDRVGLKTINCRLNPIENNKDVTGKYIEDISKTPLSIDDFKLNHDIIKSALNEETKSRIRICYDHTGSIYFVIVWMLPIGLFSFNNQTFTLTKIPADGNCLFNCFVKAKITPKHISRLRGDVSSYIEDNIQDYTDFIGHYNSEKLGELIDTIRTNGEWNTNISDIIPNVLSKMLEVNVYIYSFNTNLLSGGEELSFTEPHIITGNNKYDKTIYLKQSNLNHYDLFETNS